MKKFLFFASALAGLFLAASCQQESLEPVGGNTVTYTVQVPDALATKALGDDVTNVNVVHYEVYRTAVAETVEFTTDDNLLYHKTAAMSNGTATINLELVNDQNYTVLFWAQVQADMTALENEAYVVSDLTKVTIKSALNSNKEAYAAFAGVDFIEAGEPLAGRNVTLVRPISQLNIATTPGSLTAFDDDITLNGSSVTVAGLSNTFDVAKQEPSAAMATTYTYSEQAVPTQTLSVNGENYAYVAMNYVGFAAGIGSNVKVSYVINTSEGDIDNSIENVPVKPNFRTNIVGNLITATSDYTIDLSDEWSGVAEEIEVWDGELLSPPEQNSVGEYLVNKPSELAWLADEVKKGNKFEGKTFYLTSDVDLGNYPWTPIGTDNDANISFKGTFEGVNLNLTKADAPVYPTIRNLNVDLTSNPSNRGAGLFATIRGNAILRNFNVENAVIKNLITGNTINGTAVVVGSAAYENALVENVHVKNAVVEGNRNLAGIVGYMNGTVKNCTVEDIQLTATPNLISENLYDNGDKAGGIIGNTNGDGDAVIGCSVKNITVKGYRDIGGIAGAAYPALFENNIVDGITIIIDGSHVPYADNKTATTAENGIVGKVYGTLPASNTSTNVTFYPAEQVTIVKPGESLQAAVDAAAVIYLAEGTHTGHTVINKSVTLLPVSGASVIYDGHLSAQSGDVLIQNITFTNEHPSSTPVPHDSGTPTKHLSCVSAYVANVTLENCTFDIKAQTGYFDYAGSTSVLKNCVFKCNGQRPIQSRTRIDIDGCKFYDQYRYAVQVQGEISGNQVVNFKNNQIINPCVTSGKGFVAGVSISGSRKCENVTFNISGNTLTSSLFNELIYVYDNNANINIGSCTVNGAEFIREDEVMSTKAASSEEDLINATASDAVVLQNDMELVFAENPMYNNINAAIIDLNGKTLTIKEGDLRFANTTIKNGNIVVEPKNYNGTAVFLMYGENKLIIENTKITATGISGTYLIGLENSTNLELINSEILIDNPSLVNLTAAIACNGTGMTTVKNSNIVVKNINGRAFLNTSCSVENSTVTADYVKAGFYIPNGKTLSIDATSTVTITNLVDGKVNGIDLYGNAEYTVADGATVNATVGRN